MLEGKLKTGNDYFFMMKKDPKARSKKSKVMHESYQVPPHASFDNVNEEDAARVCSRRTQRESLQRWICTIPAHQNLALAARQVDDSQEEGGWKKC
jgi:hypothetical protein